MRGDDPEQGDPDRDAILRRRNRFVALALSGVAAAALGGCEPCLSPMHDASGGEDAGPMPFDGAARDAATEHRDGGAGDAGPDGGPLPCLAPKP